VFILAIDLASSHFFRSSSQVSDDRDVPGRGKRSRSVREDHGTLDVRRQVSSRHSINLWVIDVCYKGRWGSYDAAPRASTRVPHADRWTRSMVSDDLIYIRQCLLRSGSFYRTLHPHPKIVQGIPVVDLVLKKPSALETSISSHRLGKDLSS
jgi:hypothetical protein